VLGHLLFYSFNQAEVVVSERGELVHLPAAYLIQLVTAAAAVLDQGVVLSVEDFQTDFSVCKLAQLHGLLEQAEPPLLEGYPPNPIVLNFLY